MEKYINNKDIVKISIDNNNKLNLIFNSKSYLIENGNYFTLDNNNKIIFHNDNNYSNFKKNIEIITIFHYNYYNNKLTINIKSYKLFHYNGIRFDIDNNYIFNQPFFITSNSKITKLKITHNYNVLISHNGDYASSMLDLYIDYMPNLKKINARNCIIHMNENNKNVKSLNISHLNEFINNLELKKIIYHPGVMQEIDSYNYNFFDFKNVNSLTDFIKNQKYINKLIFNNASIIINTSFNKIINCFNTALLFKDNFNLKYLKLENNLSIELLQNNYFIDKLIIKSQYEFHQIKNDFNNFIHCNKVIILINNININKNNIDKIINEIINLLKIIKTRDLILQINIGRYDEQLFNKFNKQFFNKQLINIFKNNLYQNIIIQIVNFINLNIIKNNNNYQILDINYDNKEINNILEMVNSMNK